MAERDLTVLPIRHTVAALYEVTTLLMARHDVDGFVETYREDLTEAHDGLRAVLDRLPAPEHTRSP